MQSDKNYHNGINNDMTIIQELSELGETEAVDRLLALLNQKWYYPKWIGYTGQDHEVEIKQVLGGYSNYRQKLSRALIQLYQDKRIDQKTKERIKEYRSSITGFERIYNPRAYDTPDDSHWIVLDERIRVGPDHFPE
ncbi:MAG: hypothetical protein HPY76_03940 [Anaerolineae bacterium]|jgi:hypothetical protein|nr:hypothetical protein [Anaerolineae bacterium]